MTGDISSAIAFTTYGNAFLKRNFDISSLTLEHPLFRFQNKLEFLFFKTHLIGKPTWHLYADSPVNWLKKLRDESCQEIRFVFRPDNYISLNGEIVPDHKLAGFVGGGGHRFIETVFKYHSDFWESNSEVTNKDAPDKRIWTTTYARTFTGQPTAAKKTYDIQNLKQRLRIKLEEVSSFAKKENLPYWVQRFDKAKNLLDSSSIDKSKLYVPAEIMSDSTLQLLAASGDAWYFGGMGSWNDLLFDDKESEAMYDKLSAELYDVINEAYLAVANS